MTVPHVDGGRAAQKAATRDAIADAVLDLIAAGDLRPTAREIAARAGISVRSVYVHFDDLEDLFAVAARRHVERIAPLLEEVPADGPLRDRAEGLVRRRIELYDQIGLVGRAAQLQAPFSPTLAVIVADAERYTADEAARVFGRELARMSPARRHDTMAMLDVVLGFDAWQRLTGRHGMTTAAVRALMLDATLHQLGGDR